MCERLNKEKLEALQLEKMRGCLKAALKTPFYRERLKKAGLKDPRDLTSLKEMEAIPFTTKEDLREAYPYGLLSCGKEDIVRMHSSSGTTGIPTVIYQNRKDLDNWTVLIERSLRAIGCKKEDVFQNMMTYGLFTGGLGLHYGAEALGMMVLPVSSGNTVRQLSVMKDFQTTVLHATPSYLLYLYSRMEELGYKREDFKLKKAIVGAEPHTEEVRQKLQKLWDIDVYNSYGLSEMNGPGVAFECEEKKGMHLWEDSYFMELVDRESFMPLSPGETGELVLTILNRTATPIIRYRTKDLTAIINDPCSCGRTSRRIQRIKGRTDDMLIINGVNVFPSQIEEVIMKQPELANNYRIDVKKSGVMDTLTVHCEWEAMKEDTLSNNRLINEIREALRAHITVNPKVELHRKGTLPVSEGKAVRVQDKREVCV